MIITELKHYDTIQFAQIAPLINSLSPSCVFTEQKLKATIQNPASHLYVIADQNQIVGCATLCIFHTPTGAKATVEDVVVASEYRGQHLGRQLMEYVIQQARQCVQEDSPTLEIHLTSKPKRLAANALYQSLGFKKKETNCYILRLVL